MKVKKMKKVITFVLILAMSVICGCQSSSKQGGGMTKDVGFKVVVPTFSTEIKQGQMQTVTVSLDRGDFFKRDVKLQIETVKGISIEPSSVIIKASDKPDVQLQISAAQDAAIGEYRVTVLGIPKTGESTSMEFNVSVVTQ